MSYDTEETEDAHIFEVMVQGSKATTFAIAPLSGTVYLNGDIHPLGAASALIRAASLNIPYIAPSAICALYPSEWLRAEAMGDTDRQRLITNLERLARSQSPQR